MSDEKPCDQSRHSEVVTVAHEKLGNTGGRHPHVADQVVSKSLYGQECTDAWSGTGR